MPQRVKRAERRRRQRSDALARSERNYELQKKIAINRALGNVCIVCGRDYDYTSPAFYCTEHWVAWFVENDGTEGLGTKLTPAEVEKLRLEVNSVLRRGR